MPPKSISDNAEKFLAPGAPVNVASDLSAIGGSAPQQAFGAEYNIATLAKLSSVAPLTNSSGGNSSGVENKVGSSLAVGGGGSGTDSSTGSNTLSAPISPDGTLSQGMTGYNQGTGWWLGVDHGTAKFSFGSAGGSSYITWDGTTLTIVGGLSVSKLDIPDTTTANSFHVDTSGNTWWGANVASGLSAANASVSSTGAAVFKNVQVGGTTTQYTVSNSGIFSFGDGSDGAGVADGATALAGASLSGSTYTLTRDVYYTNLTLSTGVIIKPSGYRIFGNGTLTLNGTATIQRNGNVGGDAGPGTSSNGAGGSGGGGGSAAAGLAAGYLSAALAGVSGGGGATPGSGSGGYSGSAGTAGLTGVTNSLGSNGSTGGGGGFSGGWGSSSPAHIDVAGTGGGTVTISNVKLIANWHLSTLLDVSSTGSTVKFTGSAGSGGGSGGSAVSSGIGQLGGGGGGGGGSGGVGGILAIYFRNIVIGASASIASIGGAGGKGGNGGDDTHSNNSAGGAGGGGAGGNGGIVILAYNTLTNSGTISVAGGAGGTQGTGGHATANNTFGSDGQVGSSGSAGTIYQFQLSL